MKTKSRSFRVKARSRSVGPVVLSIAERILARGASAVMTLLLAVFAGPNTVGQYATVVLAMTIHQALTENVVRQVGVEAWNFQNGSAFLHKSSLLSSVAGVFIVGATALIVALPGDDPGVLLKLAPLVLVPAVVGNYLPILTQAQRSPGGWKSIAKAQSIAAAASLLIAGPSLPFIGVGAASVQVLLSETLFLALIRRYSSPSGSSQRDAPLWRQYYFPTAVSSILGWSQSQLERLLLVLMATSGALGFYSLAVALARTASDAVTSGLVNAVRSQISTEATDSGKANQLHRGIVTGVKISILMQVSITAACLFLLPRFLNPSWLPALAAAPLFAVTGMFAAVTWVCSAYVIAAGESSRLFSAQITGIALSLLCGYFLSISLEAGAFMCIARDYVGMVMRLRLVNHVVTQRLVYVLAGFVLLAIVLGFASQFVPLILNGV